jgi:hypothetical protein
MGITFAHELGWKSFRGYSALDREGCLAHDFGAAPVASAATRRRRWRFPSLTANTPTHAVMKPGPSSLFNAASEVPQDSPSSGSGLVRRKLHCDNSLLRRHSPLILAGKIPCSSPSRPLVRVRGRVVSSWFLMWGSHAFYWFHEFLILHGTD